MATKAIIKVTEGKNANTDIAVLFNPNEYKLDTTTRYVHHKVTGKNGPVTQFLLKSESTLTMDLFFDTSEARTDVRDYTQQVAALLDVDGTLHTPPKCIFAWGTFSFTGVFTNINQRFTMFMDDGKPIRAVLSVTMKEYLEPGQEQAKVARESSDRTKERILKQGEELWMLAAREYEDPSQWRYIARANNVDNPRLPETAKRVIVPPLE